MQCIFDDSKLPGETSIRASLHLFNEHVKKLAPSAFLAPASQRFSSSQDASGLMCYLKAGVPNQVSKANLLTPPDMQCIIDYLGCRNDGITS
jgi:hypothetical protein